MISSTVTQSSYVANGAQHIFSYGFRILSEDDLQVYIGGVLQVAGYTVSEVDNPDGGDVTLITGGGLPNPPAAGAVVVLQRATPLTQTQLYTYPSAQHERSLDKLTMMVQEVQGEVDLIDPVLIQLARDAAAASAAAALASSQSAEGAAVVAVAAQGAAELAEVGAQEAEAAAVVAQGAAEAAQLMLNNVTNDAQLKRAANDFTAFAEKVAPVMQDKILIEDVTTGEKHYIQLSNIPSTGASSEQDIYQDVLENCKYQNVSFDDFADAALVDAVATTGTFELNDTAFSLTAGQVVQTVDLFDPASGVAAVTECMLLAVYEDAGGALFEITADGVNWQTVVPNTIVQITNPGTVLKLRFTAGGVATLESWAVFYNADESAVTEVLGTMATKDAGDYPRKDEALWGFRNKVINGCFRVWQRGTSSTQGTAMIADRWGMVGGIPGQQVAFAPGQTDVLGNPKYFLRATANGSTAGGITQKIEDVETFAGQTVTLSFWAKVNTPTEFGTFRLRQIFGSGGSGEVSTNIASSITLTTTWQKYTFTVALPSISGKTVGAGSNLLFELRQDLTAYTLDIAQVQLEEGEVATPFEQRPITVEEMLCFRYYYIPNGGGTFRIRYRAGATAVVNSRAGTVGFMTPMRVQPSITLIGIVTSNVTGDVRVSIVSSHDMAIEWDETAANTNTSVVGSYTADAEL